MKHFCLTDILNHLCEGVTANADNKTHFLRLHLSKFTESRQQPSGVGAVIMSLFQKWKGYRIGSGPCSSEPESKPKQSCLPQLLYSYPHALHTVTLK